MVFEFDQWFEAESSYVVEEWGMGTFTLKNMTLTLLLEPYIHQEKFRTKIKDQQLQIVDYKYQLNTKEQSQFESSIETFSTVFAEHMRN